MALSERLAAGFGDDDLFVIGWREEPERDGPTRSDHHGTGGGPLGPGCASLAYCVTSGKEGTATSSSANPF